jgi:hypothetical protein
MNNSGNSMATRSIACAAALFCIAIGTAEAGQAFTNPVGPEALRARFAALNKEPGQNRFLRPLHLESSEGADGVRGEIHALVDHPFAAAGQSLVQPSQWCDILILHLNTKYCRPSAGGGRSLLHVVIGKKFDQPLGDAYRVDFDFRVAAMTATYLQVTLGAAEGPLGTRDYRIVVEATPSEDGRTIMRLSYSYTYGMAGRLAMQAYLGTVGRNKVGFAVIGTQSDGQPRYIDGMRGVVERNTMRYYLAIEAFLGALAVPATARMEKRFLDWFVASERFPRQLHEMEQGDYMAMKRREYARQNAQSLTSLATMAGDGG